MYICSQWDNFLNSRRGEEITIELFLKDVEFQCMESDIKNIKEQNKTVKYHVDPGEMSSLYIEHRSKNDSFTHSPPKSFPIFSEKKNTWSLHPGYIDSENFDKCKSCTDLHRFSLLFLYMISSLFTSNHLLFKPN